MEEWKIIKGFEDYQISNQGRVKSFKRIKDNIMTPCLDGGGYYKVTLRKNNKAKTKKIHQLVAIAFLGHTPCGLDLVVDHINEIKTDNRLVNLQIVTNRFNTYKSYQKKGGCSSEHTGVCWDKTAKKWKSSIKINGKDKHLGYFIIEEEAAKAYQSVLILKNNNL